MNTTSHEASTVLKLCRCFESSLTNARIHPIGSPDSYSTCVNENAILIFLSCSLDERTRAEPHGYGLSKPVHRFLLIIVPGRCTEASLLSRFLVLSALCIPADSVWWPAGWRMPKPDKRTNTCTEHEFGS